MWTKVPLISFKIIHFIPLIDPLLKCFTYTWAFEASLSYRLSYIIFLVAFNSSQHVSPFLNKECIDSSTTCHLRRHPFGVNNKLYLNPCCVRLDYSFLRLESKISEPDCEPDSTALWISCKWRAVEGKPHFL